MVDVPERRVRATASELPTGRVTVQITADVFPNEADPATLRRLIAERGGATELTSGLNRSAFELHVDRVLEGRLDTNPGGWVRVILLGEAAHAASAHEAFAGVWTLTRLADGTLLVEDLGDTPFAPSAVAHRDALRARIAEGLASNDPTYQTLALASLTEHRMLEFTPQVIALLDSEEVATGRPWVRDRHGSVAHAASNALDNLVGPLHDDTMPSPGDPAADWRRWWDETIAAKQP